MLEPYTGLKKANFGFLGFNWNQADHVVLLMYDASSHSFGFINQRIIETASKKVVKGPTRNPALIVAKNVFRIMLSELGFRWSSFDPKFEYVGSVAYRYQTRHYVRVVGHHFSQLAGRGYQTFDPAGDLQSVLGQKNGQAFAEILGKYPLLNNQAA